MVCGGIWFFKFITAQALRSLALKTNKTVEIGAIWQMSPHEWLLSVVGLVW